MLLGLAKGKVGDLVFYRDGGEQRTRTRVVPKNPRTFAQQAQRVKIANVSGIFRAAADILRDSFVSRPANQSGFNAFAARAISNAPYLTKEMATAAVCIPQPAMAAKGTLPSVEFNLPDAGATGGLYINLDFETTAETTIGQVSQEMLNQLPWLQPQAELHFCMLMFSVDDSVESSPTIYQVTELHSVFKIDASSSELLSASGFEVANNTFRPSLMAEIDMDEICMGVVLQSVVDGSGRLDTSTQYFMLSDSANTLYEDYRTEEALRRAVESYNAGSEISLR